MDALALYASSSDDDNEETAVNINSCRDEEKTTPTSVAPSATSIPILTETQARQQQIFDRHVPHTVGHWAGHIYLELDPNNNEDEEDYNDDDDETDEIDANSQLRLCRERWIHRVRDLLQAQRLPIKALVLHDHWHVSLSKTFYLQHYNIESFAKSLGDALRTLSSPQLTVRVHGDQPVVLTNAQDLNDEHKSSATNKLRTFWCCKVHPPLVDLVHVIDQVLSAWRLPPFYDPPIFHTSWASAPGDWSATAAAAGPSSSTRTVTSSDCLVFTVKHVTCRIGDKLLCLPLSRGP